MARGRCEKPTKFFASLEKRNYTNKLINKLNINGKIINNKKGILQEAANFYKNLYTSKVSDPEHEIKIVRFLDNAYIKQLTDQQKQLCEGNITNEEIKSVIKNMKTDKTPGIDGIPVEFYRFFWYIRKVLKKYNFGPDIKNFLQRVV